MFKFYQVLTSIGLGNQNALKFLHLSIKVYTTFVLVRHAGRKKIRQRNYVCDLTNKKASSLTFGHVNVFKNLHYNNIRRYFCIRDFVVELSIVTCPNLCATRLCSYPVSKA